MHITTSNSVKNTEESEAEIMSVPCHVSKDGRGDDIMTHDSHIEDLQ